jgi:hypothetical protein
MPELPPVMSATSPSNILDMTFLRGVVGAATVLRCPETAERPAATQAWGKAFSGAASTGEASMLSERTNARLKEAHG